MAGNRYQERETLELVRADSVEPEAINWLWPEWLAAGKFHLLAGRAGTGKTTLAIGIAATISRAARWPDGSTAKQGHVLMWSGEDGIEDTLLPRFMAANGDRKHMSFVSSVRTKAGERRPFIPSTDIPLVKEALQRLPNARLLIVDPLIVAVAGNSNRSTDVRRGLQPLADLAAQHNIAVLGITHFNKGIAEGHQLDRVTGSLAFGAAARFVWGTAEKQGDHRLVRIKSNLSSDRGGFHYKLEQKELPKQLTAQTVVWGDPLTGAGSDLLAELDPGFEERTSRLSEAKVWLRSLLAMGSMPAEEVRKAAEAAHFSWRTVDRASGLLKIKKKKVGMEGGWTWELPPDSTSPDV